jgi:hypothetical protein
LSRSCLSVTYNLPSNFPSITKKILSWKLKEENTDLKGDQYKVHTGLKYSKEEKRRQI